MFFNFISFLKLLKLLFPSVFKLTDQNLHTNINNIIDK